jgi:hypothetical protein
LNVIRRQKVRSVHKQVSLAQPTHCT